MRGVRGVFERIAGLFCRPTLARRGRRVAPASCDSRPPRAPLPEPWLDAAPLVGEFEFARAIEAYEAVIDAACREEGR